MAKLFLLLAFLFNLYVMIEGSQNFTVDVASFVFREDKIKVDFRSLVGDYNDQLLISIMNPSDSCPDVQYQVITNKLNGSVFLNVPTNGSIEEVTVSLYSFYNTSALTCNNLTLTLEATAVVSIKNSSIPFGNSGYSMFFGYEPRFPEEMDQFRSILKADPYRNADWAYLEKDTCDPTSFIELGPFTLESWVKATDINGCCSTIFFAKDVLEVRISDGGRLRFRSPLENNPDPTCFISLDSNKSIADNIWHHTAVVYDGLNVTLYIDGELSASGIYNCTKNVPGSRLIAVGNNALLSFPQDKNDKELDELRFWKKTRTLSEIRNTMNRTLRPFEINEDLVFYFDFDLKEGDDKSTLKNRAGNEVITLGNKDIGSFIISPIRRFSPQYVVSKAQILETPLVIIVERSASSKTDTFKEVFSSPNSLLAQNTNYRFLRIDEGLTLKRSGGNTISLNTIVDNTQSISVLVSKDLPDGRYYFEYEIGKSGDGLVWSGSILAIVDLISYLPTPLGQQGSALFCDGNSFGLAENFILPIDQASGKTISYTVEFWALNFYSPIRERVGTVYSIGNNEVYGNWCGKTPNCIGRIMTHFNDPVIEVYNGWEPSNNDGKLNYYNNKNWGEWTHYAIVSDMSSNNLTFYVNGKSVNTVKNFGAVGDAKGIYLCHWPYYGQGIHSFVGLLDEFRIWSEVRTSDQIIDYITTTFEEKDVKTMDKLMLYYTFDEVSSLTESSSIKFAKDRTGKGNDLIFGGCSTCVSDSCDPLVVPQRPCYLNSTQMNLPERFPKLAQSRAPVGGFYSKDHKAGELIQINLFSSTFFGKNVLFILDSLPTKGYLKDSNNNIYNTINSTIPSTLIYVPNVSEGGNPYTYFTIRSTNGVSSSKIPLYLEIKILCPPGTYLSNSNKCLECPVGSYSDSYSYNSSCTLCDTDTFQNSTGSAFCKRCEVGTEQPMKGGSECIRCAKQIEGSEQCPVIFAAFVDKSQGAGIAIIILTVICMVFNLFILITLYYYRNTPLVRASSPLFCYLIIIGLLLSYSVNFLYIGPLNDAQCALRPWIIAIAISLILGGLLAKTYRIYRIFCQKMVSQQLSFIGNKSLLGFSLAITILECILPAIWTIVSPLKRKLISGGSPYYTCQSDNIGFGWGMMGGMVAINLGLILYGCFLAFKTRRVHSDFKESTFIGFSMYNLLIGMTVILPIMFISGAGFWVVTILRTLGILFCTSFIALAMFGPKLYILFFEKEKNVVKMAFNMSSRKDETSSFNEPIKAANGVIRGIVQAQEEQDSFINLLSQNKWVSREVCVITDQKLIGWKDPGIPKTGKSYFESLKNTYLNSFTVDSENILEVTGEGWQFRMKMEKEDEFATWINAFRSSGTKISPQSISTVSNSLLTTPNKDMKSSESKPVE